MLNRPKLFLRFLALCGTPLVLLGFLNFWHATRAARLVVRRDVQTGVGAVNAELSECLVERENELDELARSAVVREFLSGPSLQDATQQSHGQPELRPQISDLKTDDRLNALKIKLASLLNDTTHLTHVVVYSNDRRPLLLGQRKKSQHGSGELVFYDKDFPPGMPKPDDSAASSEKPVRSPISIHAEGTSSRLTATVPASDAQTAQGLLVADQNLDALFEQAAKSWELRPQGETRAGVVGWDVLILHDSGKILYHTNRAILRQPVTEAMDYFAPTAQRMLERQSGVQSFTSAVGDETEVAFTHFPALNVSIAATKNAQPALAAARRTGLITLLGALLFAVALALVLTHYWQRRARGIQRLADGVAQIREGKLDHRIEVQSSVDMRPLAEDMNLVREQLREQVAREAEGQQFQSFVRLSAMLTHDLKNAIEALSLIVGNMERHFDNPDFRADAMKSLNLATQNLRGIVDRLASPMETLSGEYKRPRPTDLVPLLRRSIAMTAEPVREKHQIETRLPPSLFALVDAERMSKVIENLLLNALEAMSEKSGRLTVEAGTTDDDKVFFTVSDTGIGMTQEFLERRLFRPFATTKKRGVGLGLYTCKEFVETNGGSITANSIQGAGTTFRVVLPSASSGGHNVGPTGTA